MNNNTKKLWIASRRHTTHLPLGRHRRRSQDHGKVAWNGFRGDRPEVVREFEIEDEERFKSSPKPTLVEVYH